jgi:hypothetical protein
MAANRDSEAILDIADDAEQIQHEHISKIHLR